MVLCIVNFFKKKKKEEKIGRLELIPSNQASCLTSSECSRQKVKVWNGQYGVGNYFSFVAFLTRVSKSLGVSLHLVPIEPLGLGVTGQTLDTRVN